MYQLLTALDTQKASGADGISAKMLKATAQSITPSLTMLFNKSIIRGEVPQKWNITSVVSISKPGKDPSVPYNYRPISLLSVVSKILERHMHSFTLAQ